MNAIAQTVDPVLRLESTYARLPESFFRRIAPTPVAKPRLLRLNDALVQQLGLDAQALASEAGVAVLAGNRVPEGAQPIAMAYAGHQFGGFVPSLGDGRAVLLGEVVDRDGVRRDIHLKGAGRTPFSRGGDGRAALGPVLREYVISEAMAGLGIPTTRALAMLETGEPVYRQVPQPGAILVRVAAGHVRVGTFEYFHHRGDTDAVRTLAEHVIARHYPGCALAENRYRALLDAVLVRQADLIARWMLVGFIHGVMNTDNSSITGETIDYGPCAFMDTFHPQTVYSSIDHAGRYAYNQQARIGWWNLAQFAGCLLPLLADEQEASLASAREAVNAYGSAFEASWHAGLLAKIGLATVREGDHALALDLLSCMSEHNADFTNTFRALCDAVADDPATDREVRVLFDEPDAFDAWAARWRARLAAEPRADAERRAAMRTVNPAFIPRNHRVQQAIEAAERERDLRPLDELLAVLTSPYEDHPEHARLRTPPRPEEVVQQTFCGT